MLPQTDKNILIPTILCGGEGSRLWPLSRKSHPKQFLRIDGGESFLQKAFIRGASIPNINEILTVTSHEFLPLVQNDYNNVNEGDFPVSFLLEPCARNTAPAIASAAVLIHSLYGEDAVMLILPADHLVTDQEAFQQAVEKAVELASKGKIVTFGIRPHTPETGYGYIQADGNDVMRFVEKPSLEDATHFVVSGEFLWNSGMFCFQVGTILREMERLCPDILLGSRKAIDVGSPSVQNHTKIWNLSSDSYKNISPQSIDFAVMEKTEEAAVVPCDIGWSDVGCWKSFGVMSASDQHNNHISGEVVVEDSQNCIVSANNRLVAILGLDGVVVADTPDALLVAGRGHTQKVKSVYEKLKEKNHTVYETHKTVRRPWGAYTVLEESKYHKVKRIEVDPGARLSLQLHQHRSEHWVVVKGKAKVINGTQELTLSPQEHTFIPSLCKHRLENIGKEPLIVLEIQTGTYLGEDDIVRFDDNHNQATAI